MGSVVCYRCSHYANIHIQGKSLNVEIVFSLSLTAHDHNGNHSLHTLFNRLIKSGEMGFFLHILFAYIDLFHLISIFLSNTFFSSAIVDVELR